MVPVFCVISYLSSGYDITHNTGTIPVEEKQPDDKYDITQNTGTIPLEQKQLYDQYGMVPVLCVISYFS
jgi:hypothetical protein